ncbi:Eco57I restriction-modification methylase domain-containing protein [Xanthomonas euvesicatoria pv. allii]|uniref:Eco57I restriction-modification methylase domain-containing protein n=1 Tax=Xanthomonas euvesicatoria TaxID=456327 RepID=UPI00240697C1|nr:Eco57I restriction-modification methylase domain-containing protein [Xanthomonas euvesicatoria]MCP3041189.1 Eco57I restriction-modification methylase domain-containing protein [Xanthomonas euvesicatoria pv. allii]MCP3053174.1 Eco57I restriction-modification methylase domain-containing protein [Xanthomonas euvesicatoria pv. allii]
MLLALDDEVLLPWTNVGYFPTPEQLVKDLISALVQYLRNIRHHGHVRVLDACAGDGRLGFAVIAHLEDMGVSCDLTCIEVDAARIPSFSHSPKVTWVRDNFLSYRIEGLFDIVVSNPPYLVLNRKDAEHFGMEWSAVVGGGKNLYSLSVLKALQCCRGGGVVGLIAPHGWLRNASMSEFRRAINKYAESVDINAYSSRRLFDNVNQDTSVQILVRRSSDGNGGSACVRIRYGTGEFTNAPESVLRQSVSQMRVRVGPFVWNREKSLISESSDELRVPAIYGGNITSWHHLDLRVRRYAGRQYLRKSSVSESAISVGPCVLVKRSMRGGPGRWEVDCAYVPLGFEVVAENHVIAVENIDGFDGGFGALMGHLKYFLQTSCKHQGHPNLSARSVQEALSQLLPSKLD